VDDSFGEQVPNLLAILRLVGSENVIETPIFTNYHDDVFDRRSGLMIVVVLSLGGAGERAADRELK
jgi:hypothetical protein